MENVKQPTAEQEQFKEWVKSAGDFWLSFANAFPRSSPAPTPSGEETKGRLQESWETLIKSWQGAAVTLGDRETADVALKWLASLPDGWMKGMKAAMETGTRLYAHQAEKLGKIGEKTEAFSFDHLEKDTFRLWREIYEEEFRRYFHIPPLGLLRFYQERFNALLDEMNLLHTGLGEFFQTLALPMEKATRVLQERIAEQMQSGQAPHKPKEYYALWIKILEGHYMALLRSPEFLALLRDTLSRVETFKTAKDQVLQDLLQVLPIPTTRDMEALYRDLHALKRRVRELEERLDAGTASGA